MSRYSDRKDYSKFGAYHYWVWRRIKKIYPDIGHSEFCALLMADSFYRRGGFFTVGEVIRCIALNEDSADMKNYMRNYFSGLDNKGYTSKDDSTGGFGRGKLRTITPKGLNLIQFYNRACGEFHTSTYENALKNAPKKKKKLNKRRS